MGADSRPYKGALFVGHASQDRHLLPLRNCLSPRLQEFMSTKSLPKNRRKALIRQGFAALPKHGVYQNVYQGHFGGGKAGLSRPLFVFPELF